MNKELNVDLKFVLKPMSDGSFYLEGYMRCQMEYAGDFLISTLQLNNVLVNGEPFQYDLAGGVIKVPAAEELEFDYVSINPVILMPVPLTLKISISSFVLQPQDVLVSRQTYAQNFRAFLPPSNLLRAGQVKYDPLLERHVPDFESIQFPAIILDGFYNAMRVGGCTVLWLPRNAPKLASMALFKSSQVIFETFQDSNVSLEIYSSAARHALLLHFFFGFLAKSNYFGYFCLKNSILNQPYCELDKQRYYDEYGPKYHLYCACLALAIIPLKFVREQPQFSQDNAKSAHNSMLKQAFEKFQADYQPDVFPTQGIEPGDVFRFAFQDLLSFSAQLREFVVQRSGRYAMLQFTSKSDWRLQLNRLYAESLENVENKDITAFRRAVLNLNLEVEQQFDFLQVFYASSVQKQRVRRVEERVNRLPVDQIDRDVMTCMQCFLVDQEAPVTYRDDICDEISSPAGQFLKYTGFLAPITIRPEYIYEIETDLGGIISNLLQFNLLQESEQAARLDMMARQLYEALKCSVLGLFASQAIERELDAFIRNAMALQLLFTSDAANRRIFELIGDLKVFLRGVALNVANSFEVRELSVMFLLFLQDCVWIKQILTYLQNQLAESTSNSAQIMNLLTSLWPAIITLQDVVCDEILLEMLEHQPERFSNFWLERMCYGYVSNYTLEETIKKSSNASLITKILLFQLLYFTEDSQSRADMLLAQLRNIDFSLYKTQLAELILFYSTGCPEAIREFLHTTHQIVNIQDYISETFIENGDTELLALLALKKQDETAFVSGMMAFLGGISFLEWNTICLPRFALITRKLTDVSDYSCPGCFCGTCGCARSKILKRLGVDYGEEIEHQQVQPPTSTLEIRYGEYLLYVAPNRDVE